MIRRAPWWFPPISFVGITAGVVLVSLFHPWTATPLLPFAITGQLCLLLIILRAFAYWPPVKRWLAAMPVPHRVIFGVLIGGMILGHYTLNGRTYFPFVAWEIFPHVEKSSTVTAREFIGTTVGGAKVRLLAEQQFPSIIQIDRVEDLDRNYGAGTTDSLALALAKMYNAHHRTDPVREVDLMTMAVNLHPPASEARNEPSCELFEILRRLPGPLELLHEQAGPRLLRFAQLGIFALWIVKLLLDPLSRLASMPMTMLRPVGVLNLFSTDALFDLFTPQELSSLWVFTVLILIACLFVRLPIGSALLYTVAAIFLTVYSSVIRSFGPAVHTDIVLLLSVYALAGFAWADLFAPKAPGRYSYPLITIAGMLCLAYTLVGLNRACAGGIGVFTGDTMTAWAVDASLRGYYFNTNIGWHVPEWPLVNFMLCAGLPAITVFEITAPLCLASPYYRRVFIPVMLSFHALSLVFMNIFFFDDMMLYLLLIDWSRLFPAMRRSAGSFPAD